MKRYIAAGLGGLLLASWVPAIAYEFAPRARVLVPAPCGPYVRFHGGVTHEGRGYDDFGTPYRRFSHQRHSRSRLRSYITGWTGGRTDYVWRNSGPHVRGYRWLITSRPVLR